MKKNFLIVIGIIFLFTGFILAGFFYENRIHEQRPVINEERKIQTLASFGEPVNFQEIGINNSIDFFKLLQKVTNESDKDLVKYYYPDGPILGAGYDENGTVVMIYKNWSVNETTIGEIYQVIEKHGEENGIKKIPSTFFSVDMVKMDSQLSVDDSPLYRYDTPTVVPQHTFISPPSHTSDYYRISVSGFFPRKDTVSISNNGSIPVSLYGWKLITEPGNLKFTLPVFSLSPGKSVMVFLNKSGRNTEDELFSGDGALTGNISSIGLYDDLGNQIVFIEPDIPVPEMNLPAEQNVSSPDAGPPENKTAAAIGIALNDSSVRTYLTGPWTITGVSLNAGITFAHDGKEESFRTPVVIFDTESRVVDVYVDMENRSVVYISESPKRVPMPVKTPG